MKHIRPRILTAQDVREAIGHHWVCPYCDVESTKNPTDIGWVLTQLRQTEPKYICLGCCEDIFSACSFGDLSVHPYLDIVQHAANIEQLTLREFQRICLLDQLEAAEWRIVEDPERYSERRICLHRLLREIGCEIEPE